MIATDTREDQARNLLAVIRRQDHRVSLVGEADGSEWVAVTSRYGVVLSAEVLCSVRALRAELIGVLRTGG